MLSKKLLSIFLSFLFLFTISFQKNLLSKEDVKSAKYIFENYNTDEIVYGFALGIMDGLVYYMQTQEALRPNSLKLFCFSNENALTSEEYFKLIQAEYIKNKNEFSDSRFEFIALLALMELHPCK